MDIPDECFGDLPARRRVHDDQTRDVAGVPGAAGSGPCRKLTEAFSALPRMAWEKRKWLEYEAPELIAKAAPGMAPNEEVIEVAIGQTFSGRQEGLVVTTRQFGLLSRKGVHWLDRESVHARLDLGGLTITGPGFKGSWTHLAPKSIAARMTMGLGGFRNRDGRYPVEVSSPSRPQGPAASGRATFLGGDFIGNTARAKAFADRDAEIFSPLKARNTVSISLTRDDQIVIYHGQKERARYPATSPFIEIDRESRIKRRLRGGPLAGTAAATLLLGPIGLLGLLASTRVEAQAAWILVVDDRTDHGVFSLTDGATGVAIEHAHRNVTADLEPVAEPVHPEPSRAVPSQGDIITALERLSGLRASGVITAEELESFKSRLVASAAQQPEPVKKAIALEDLVRAHGQGLITDDEFLQLKEALPGEIR